MARTVAIGEEDGGYGGFGNALEPDFRLPLSTPMATSIGLRHLKKG